MSSVSGPPTRWRCVRGWLMCLLWAYEHDFAAISPFLSQRIGTLCRHLCRSLWLEQKNAGWRSGRSEGDSKSFSARRPHGPLTPHAVNVPSGSRVISLVRPTGCPEFNSVRHLRTGCRSQLWGMGLRPLRMKVRWGCPLWCYRQSHTGSSISCPGIMHWPPLPPVTGLSLPVAVGALLRPPELLRPMLNRHLGRSLSLSQESGTPRRSWSLLFLRRWREQRRFFPRWRAGRRILCFIFFLFHPPPFSKKEQFPFPPDSYFHGMTVYDVLLPHSRSRTILPAAKRAWFRDAVLPHAPLARPVWDPGSSARTPQNVPPSIPSSPYIPMLQSWTIAGCQGLVLGSSA